MANDVLAISDAAVMLHFATTSLAIIRGAARLGPNRCGEQRSQVGPPTCGVHREEIPGSEIGRDGDRTVVLGERRVRESFRAPRGSKARNYAGSDRWPLRE
ncbi:MAG TPA: hypothetical protein VGV57_07675 [Thermoleophilaceae bacterium]|nr:hypothetical protein [Thermoleophilaceae bacterium]